MITETHAVVAPVPAPDHGSYVDWPAVFAGAVFAAAIAVVLLTFGSAIGLTMVSPLRGEGVSPQWFAIAAAAWLIWVSVTSVMGGAYLTGRLRRRVNDATEHEVDIRDGAHGLIVWAASALIVALLAAIGVSGIAASATKIASSATKTAANAVVEEATDDGDGQMAYWVDTLFRADARSAAAPAPAAAPATGATTDAATAGAARPPADDAAPADSRGEVARILRASLAAGELPEPDRDYVARVVQSATGVDESTARQRVDELVERAEAAEEKARAAAEKARKAGVVLAFVNAAALLAAAVGGFIAAGIGGRHRDDGTVFTNWGLRRVPVR